MTDYQGNSRASRAIVLSVFFTLLALTGSTGVAGEVDKTKVGSYKVIEMKRGKAVSYIHLSKDGTAKDSNKPGVEGSWEVEGREVRITWGDNWRTIIKTGKDGKEKVLDFKPVGRKPSNWDGQVSSVSNTVKLSTEDAAKQLAVDDAAFASVKLAERVARLPRLDANALALDAVGLTDSLEIIVFQVIDKETMLVNVRTYGSKEKTLVMLKFNTEGVTDDTGIILPADMQFKVDSTTKYTTAARSTRTVFLIKPVK